MGLTGGLPAAGCTDVMCDIETTSTSPETGAIVQVAAVKFNYLTGEIGGVFNRSLHMPYGRFWDESTRTWWGQQDPTVWQGIVERMEDPADVMREFFEFSVIDAPYGGYRFWSKPLSFDFPFVASYFKQFGHENPYHFRHARDLNTWIAALRGKGPAHVGMDHIEFEGKAHNALVDAVHQIKLLFAARDGDWGELSHIQDAVFEEISA